MKTIFCAIHGYTHWEDCLLAIINTPEFQRLKRIKQLAAVHHVFPCATHTRFEHSIGVGHLAELFASHLAKRHAELSINPLTLKLAGLCHDLGHGPLSHAYDAFLHTARPGSPMHEERSVVLLRAIVRRHAIPIAQRLVDDACELIAPVKRDLPLFMYQIIANEVDGIDVDKLDYLCRDSRNTGMPYHVDVHRFFEYACVVNERICYPLRMAPTIHHLVSVRHQLHLQVYQHRVVRALELMYMDILYALGDAAFEYRMLTDTIFTREFARCKRLEQRIDARAYARIVGLLDDIDERRLYRCVFEQALGSEITFEDLTPALECLDDRTFVIDRLQIGYVEHPLFRVSFVDKSGNTATLNPQTTSCTYVVRQQDSVLRIYNRTQKTDGSGASSV